MGEVCWVSGNPIRSCGGLRSCDTGLQMQEAKAEYPYRAFGRLAIYCCSLIVPMAQRCVQLMTLARMLFHFNSLLPFRWRRREVNHALDVCDEMNESSILPDL